MVRWLGWYGPKQGRGSVEDKVSHKPQVKAELGFQAGLIYARAATNLEVLPRERTGQSQVKIEGPGSGRLLDWVVSLDGGEFSKGASIGIEKRHGIIAEAVGRARRRGAGI